MGIHSMIAFLETKLLRRSIWEIQNRSRVFVNGILADANTLTNVTGILRFQSKQIDTNGTEYNITNGRFTAQKTGMYEINVFLYVLGVESGKNVLAYMYKNGVVIPSGGGIIGLETNGYSATATIGMTSGKHIIELNAGDYIDIRARVSNISAGASWNSASTISVVGVK